MNLPGLFQTRVATVLRLLGALLLVLVGLLPRAEAIGSTYVSAEPPAPVDQPLPEHDVIDLLAAYRGQGPPLAAERIESGSWRASTGAWRLLAPSEALAVVVFTYDPEAGAQSRRCSFVAFVRTSTHSTWAVYKGEWRDQTGLSYLRNRYMDPTIGRFTQSDPSGAETNDYAYAGSDPVNNIDPMGLDHIEVDGDDDIEWVDDDGTKHRIPGGSILKVPGSVQYNQKGIGAVDIGKLGAVATHQHHTAGSRFWTSTDIQQLVRHFVENREIHDRDWGMHDYLSAANDMTGSLFRMDSEYSELQSDSLERPAFTQGVPGGAYALSYSLTNAASLGSLERAYGPLSQDPLLSEPGQQFTVQAVGIGTLAYGVSSLPRLAQGLPGVFDSILGGTGAEPRLAGVYSGGVLAGPGVASLDGKSAVDVLMAAASTPYTGPTVGGRRPINSGYAGQTHPAGVKFNSQGFPDFSPYAVATVRLKGLTGIYRTDEVLANQASGLTGTPVGYVWHHVEDGETMQLIPQDIHSAVRHTGGSAIIQNGGLDP